MFVREAVCVLRLQSAKPLPGPPFMSAHTRSLVSRNPTEDRITQCYIILGIPHNSSQEMIRKAFLALAKKHHPDSGTEHANIEKFCEIDDAFRDLTKKSTCSTCSTSQVENIEYNIKHTVAQHRQYLNFGGTGHGTPMQREKQYIQMRAQKAAENVMEHRISRAIASENTLMKEEDMKLKHDIKTQVGFDRLVEDLIQESMSKGEFDNLNGKGKPLMEQNCNPYVDFTTHKINEVLINNGYTPEWITLNRDIGEEIGFLKEELKKERSRLGPLPLTEEEQLRWDSICNHFEESATKINSRIISFNLIVPLINKQMFLLKYQEVTKDILLHGTFNRNTEPAIEKEIQKDALMDIFKAINNAFALLTSFIKR